MRSAAVASLLGSLGAAFAQTLQPIDPLFAMASADSANPPFDTHPMKNATARDLRVVLNSIATHSASTGFHHKMSLDLPSGTIRFLLWLPAGFHTTSAQQWPTVFFLHGAAEGQFPNGSSITNLDACAPYPCTLGSEISKVARHGLPHKIEENAPFNQKFVLVSPQRPLVNGGGDGWSKWSEHVQILDELRSTLFASSDALDPQRAYLTGLSSGAVGALAWAGFSPSGQQPWAAVVPASVAWPYREHDQDPTNLRMMEPAAVERLARMNILVSHCVNDATFEIEMGSKGQPPCVVQRLGDDSATMCGFSADAIVEALRAAGAKNVRYDRLQECRSPRMPTDTGPLKASWYNALQEGHDAWSRLYASADFTQWLLRQRLEPA